MGLSKRVDDAERSLEPDDYSVRLSWADDGEEWPGPENVNRWVDAEGNLWVRLTWGDLDEEEVEL